MKDIARAGVNTWGGLTLLSRSAGVNVVLYLSDAAVSVPDMSFISLESWFSGLCEKSCMFFFFLLHSLAVFRDFIKSDYCYSFFY